MWNWHPSWFISSAQCTQRDAQLPRQLLSQWANPKDGGCHSENLGSRGICGARRVKPVPSKLAVPPLSLCGVEKWIVVFQGSVIGRRRFTLEKLPGPLGGSASAHVSLTSSSTFASIMWDPSWWKGHDPSLWEYLQFASCLLMQLFHLSRNAFWVVVVTLLAIVGEGYV